MVSGHGSISAALMFIADGCSEQDMQSGYALSGIDGNRFKSFCHEQDINFNDSYRTALVKDRINLNKPEANRGLVTEEYRQILYNEIQVVNPAIIVPVSELAFEFVTGLKGITKFRGSLLPTSDRIITTTHKTIPVLGPAPYINQDPKMEFITRLDFAKISKHLQTKDDPIKEIGVCWIAKDVTTLREFIKRHYYVCIAKKLEEGGFLNFDIETFCGIPTCISLCFDGNESVTVPIIDKNIPFAERMLMLSEVARLLNAPIPKANQNIKFDWRKLEQRLQIKVNNVAGDSMLAASCLYPEFPKNLGFLTSIYTDMPYFKDEGKEYDPSKHNRERLYLYCAKDSVASHQIHKQQITEMKDAGTLPVYQQLIRILPIYKRMEEIGIRVDMQLNDSLQAKYDTMYEIQLRKIRTLINNDEFNPLSDDQVRTLVYDELGYKLVPGIKKTKMKGLPAVDEESLELLMWMSESNSTRGNEILRTEIACRKLHKVLEYLVSPIHPDGRARCEFNLAGAETGRTTTSSTSDGMFLIHKGKIKFKDVGRSFQNIGKHGFEVDGVTLGKDIRSQFIPSPGYVFVEGDLSQAEARVDAVLAKDFDILSVFDGPVGIHRLTGSWIFDCDPMEIKKNILVDGIDRYHQAKTGRHACERNITSKRLVMMLHRPERECQTILNKVHANQPNIREVFHHEIRMVLQKERSLRSPNGRKRDFFGRYDKDMINEAISTLPQAIVTDYLKHGIDVIFNDKGGKDWIHPLSEAHDGFLVEVPKGRQEEYGKLFKESVEVPIDFSTCSLPRNFKLVIPSEVEWSDTNWKSMKALNF